MAHSGDEEHPGKNVPNFALYSVINLYCNVNLLRVYEFVVGGQPTTWDGWCQKAPSYARYLQAFRLCISIREGVTLKRMAQTHVLLMC